MRVIPLPPPVDEALTRLRRAGHEAYVVGGCVRDAYRGVPPDDWDITTSATPDEVKAVFPHARVVDTGLRHGTVTVILASTPMEITTYRVDGPYTDHRRPDSVRYTKSLRDDLARRDYTMNAIAYAPGEWVDPFGGRADIDDRRIRCVGDARKRFAEDALRIMRGLRFRAALGFVIDPATRSALMEMARTLRAVAVERLTKELSRMLLGLAIEPVLLEYRAVLAVIVPEIEGIPREAWAAAARAVAMAPESLPVRLAILFRFCADPGRAIRRLRLDRDTQVRAEALTQMHGLPLPLDRGAILRLLYAHGARAVLDLLDMREALPGGEDEGAEARDSWGEVLGGGDGHRQAAAGSAAEAAGRRHPARALVEALIAQDAYTLAALPVRGQDLIERGYQGRAIGRTLEALLFAVFDGKVPGERGALLEYLDREPCRGS